MGLFEFFGANYTAATSSPAADSRTSGNGPQNFALSNELPNNRQLSDSSSSTPSARSISDSSESDTNSNRNNSANFRKPFASSESSSSSSSSESESNVSLSQSEKRQTRSDGSSSGSPKSNKVFDPWESKGNQASSSGASSPGSRSRSSGSSSTESSLHEARAAASDGENSTAAGETSLNTSDTYGWPTQPAKTSEEKLDNSKSSSSGSRTPQRDNADREGSNSASSSKESGSQGSMARQQPGNKKKSGGSKDDEGSDSSSSEESSYSEDSSVPAGPIPEETVFKTGVVSEGSFSSVSSSSSEESGSSNEDSDEESSYDSRKDSTESGSSLSGSSSSESARQEAKEKASPLSGSESSASGKETQEDGSLEKKQLSGLSSASSSTRYEMKSDADLFRSMNSPGSFAKKAQKKGKSRSSHSSKSSGSSSDESSVKEVSLHHAPPPAPPLPEPHIEKLKGGSTDSSYYSPQSSQSSGSSGSSKPKNKRERDDGSLSSSSSSNSRRHKKSSGYVPPPEPAASPDKPKDKAGSDSGSSKAPEDVNNFALDKKLEIRSDSSSSKSDPPASIKKPKTWSDFVPTPSSEQKKKRKAWSDFVPSASPEVKDSAEATTPSAHDSDEFQWVPSDKNGWMPPVVRSMPQVRSFPARDLRPVETQPFVPYPHPQNDFVPQEMYKPDPPFGNSGRSNENVVESKEMPPLHANILAIGTHRQDVANSVRNMPPVPPMDRKMRRRDYHGVPPMEEISVIPGYEDESTLGTEMFHYAPLMMGGLGMVDHQPQYSIPNTRQLNPWPGVRMSEVLRNAHTGEDPPEEKVDRASSYLQFINPTKPPTPPEPPAKAQETLPVQKSHPSHVINAGFSRRGEGSENSWVPTQLKSEWKSGGRSFPLVPPKEEPTLQDLKDLVYSQRTKPPSVKSNSDSSNWNPIQTVNGPSGDAPPLAMQKPTESFTDEPIVETVSVGEESEEEEIIIEDEDASSSASSSMMEVTVASGQSGQESRPAAQMSEPESDDSSSGSSYHPTGILDSSSSSSSFTPRVSRPSVTTSQSKPPIVTPYQRQQSNDLEDQRQPLRGSPKPQRQTALRNAIIALGCLLLIIAAGVVVYFLTMEDKPVPLVASVNPPTNRPTNSSPTQIPSLSPTLTTESPSVSPTRSTRAPVPPPTRPPGDPDILQDSYYKLIVSAYPNGGDAIQNRSSPQRSAFEWLRSVSNVQDLPDNRILQRYALATLFYSTRGWEWSKASRWLSNEHECSWFSTSTAIDICTPTKEIAVLSLRENNLDGTIPGEVFALLPLIEEVQLHGNDLQGSIPTEMSNLSRLALFDISSNQVFSNIPTEIGRLSNLKRIALANNKIFATIPTELGRLSSLETLDLGANQLTGTIPASISSMSSLAGLSLYANYISGTVPREFSSLSNLELIYIDGNYLSGSVANSLCQLQVREFWADCDRVTCSCCTTCCTAQGCGNG